METHNSLQCTPEWYSARLFHFTSSELYKLLTEPKSKADKEGGALSQTAEAYVRDKIAEYITNGSCLDYRDINSIEVKWGKEHESDARHAYEIYTGYEVVDSPFLVWSEDFGGSPDGLVDEDGIIEIKCPYNTSVHVSYLLLQSQEDLKKMKMEYYAQIQGNLIVTGRKWCDFISYDPRCVNPSMALKILRIMPDYPFMEKCKKAIERAVTFKKQLIKQLADQCV